MDYVINPRNSWTALETAAASAATPEQAALISSVVTLLKAEISGDIDALMATLADEPVVNMWHPAGPARLEGYGTIRELYTTMFASGAEQFEFVVEKIIVGESNLVTEGRFKQVYNTRMLEDLGMGHITGDEDSGDGLWMSNAQIVVVWPVADNGKLIGQDIYFGEDPMSTLEPIDRKQLPPDFRTTV